MSADLPEVLDAWRMVAARRGFEGTLPLSSMARLRDALCDDAGVVRYSIGFDRDALGIPFVEVRAQAELPLTCQRTMERFLHPVQAVQRLALLPARRATSRCRCRRTGRCGRRTWSRTS